MATANANPSQVRKKTPQTDHVAQAVHESASRLSQAGGVAVLFLGIILMWIGRTLFHFTGSDLHGNMIGILATITVIWLTIDAWVISVPSYKVWVVLNRLTGEQYVFSRGWWITPPWCKVQFHLDARKKITIGSGIEREWPTKDGMLSRGKWTAVITLHLTKESVLKFAQSSDETIQTVLESYVDLFISNEIIKENADKILDMKGELSQKVAELFGGEEFDSPYEMKYGIDISDPRLFSLLPDNDTQKAMSGVFKAQKWGESVDVAYKKMPQKVKDEASSEEITETVQVSLGLAKKSIFRVKGLEGLRVAIGGMKELIEDKPEKK